MNSNGYVCVWEGLLQAAGDAGARDTHFTPSSVQGDLCSSVTGARLSVPAHLLGIWPTRRPQNTGS